MTRPPVPFPAEPGFEWVAVVDPDFSLGPVIEGKGCRFFVREPVADLRGFRPVSHGVPAVAVLWRRHGDGRRPWGYCAEHLFGRWIEAFEVRSWRLVRTP